MEKRPRGRPRKDGSAPIPRPKVVKEIVDPEDIPATSAERRRSSPRKRKPANFDGFVVEAPGIGVIGEGADIIEEIEEEDPIEEEYEPKEEEEEEDYKPGPPPPSAKRRSKFPKKKLSSVVSDGGDDDSTSDMVRMDDIEEDLDDPMRRVERRGRKKKQKTIEGAPKLDNQSTAAAPAKKAKVADTTESMTVAKNEETVGTAKGEGEKQPDNQDALPMPPPSSPNKSPRGSPSKTPTTAPFRAAVGGSRRKQIVAGDGDDEDGFGQREEIVEEEVPDEMIDEDLVDVESFEVPTIPQRLPMGAVQAIHARMQNKPFKCTDCGASYRREAYLLNHLATVHHDECAILSSAERSAKRAERRPERMVPRERPGEAAYKFGCDLCDRRFLRWEGLVVHQKQIHKEVTVAAKEQEKNRDYGAKCPVCLLYFFGNHALSEHVSKVHPDHNRFIFACDICGMGFMHWARVRAHKTQIHNVPVKYTQGYLKKNPEMAKIVEAQRMRKAVERNRAKRMLEKGILTGEAIGRDFNGLSRSEMNEYMYLMPPQLEPELGEAEEYEDDEEEEEEVVEEEGIIDPAEMMNIRMVPLPPASIRRTPLPPRMMSYRDNYRDYPRSYSRPHHQLAALHQRVTQLDRRDLEILNRRLPSEMDRGLPKEEEDLEVDVEREEMIEEEVVEDEMVMEEDDRGEMEEVEEEIGEDDQMPPQLDMYA